MQTTTTQAATATGWLPGAPAHVAQATQGIDRLTCAAARCPSCRRRGLAYRPMHNGHRYRVLGKCPQCGAVAEF